MSLSHYYSLKCLRWEIRFCTLWISLSQSTYEGFDTCEHIYLFLSSRNVVVYGEGSEDGGRSLDFTEPSLPHLSNEVVIAHPNISASKCRYEVHMRLYLNTPSVCNSIVLYNYKTSSLLFLLVIYLYFRTLIILKADFSRCWHVLLLLYFTNQQINWILRDAKFKIYTY